MYSSLRALTFLVDCTTFESMNQHSDLHVYHGLAWKKDFVLWRDADLKSVADSTNQSAQAPTNAPTSSQPQSFQPGFAYPAGPSPQQIPSQLQGPNNNQNISSTSTANSTPQPSARQSYPSNGVGTDSSQVAADLLDELLPPSITQQTVNQSQTASQPITNQPSQQNSHKVPWALAPPRNDPLRPRTQGPGTIHSF